MKISCEFCGVRTSSFELVIGLSCLLGFTVVAERRSLLRKTIPLTSPCNNRVCWNHTVAWRATNGSPGKYGGLRSGGGDQVLFRGCSAPTELQVAGQQASGGAGGRARGPAVSPHHALAVAD